jgi:hypothetical protein
MANVSKKKISKQIEEERSNCTHSLPFPIITIFGQDIGNGNESNITKIFSRIKLAFPIAKSKLTTARSMTIQQH